MSNTEQRERLLASSKEQNGNQAWNSWRAEDGWQTQIDLSYARLSEVDLRNTDLHDIDLRYADLRRADLKGSDLSFADLNQADLRYADLRGASLMNADLSFADLKGTDLRTADLSAAVLERTNLQMCQMDGVQFKFPVHGEPIWPEIEASVWAALQDEARSPTTPSDRLAELATHWSGYLVRHLLVANPNLPQEQAIALAPLFPGAFLSNPVLPLWFMEDPHWFPSRVAQDVLGRGQQEPGWPAVAAQHAVLVALLERCVADDSRPS